MHEQHTKKLKHFKNEFKKPLTGHQNGFYRNILKENLLFLIQICKKKKKKFILINRSGK